MNEAQSQLSFAEAWNDLAYAEIAYVLSKEGLPHCLIKGPTTRDWLFKAGERISADVDVLIPHLAVADVVLALRARGFEVQPVDDRPAARAGVLLKRPAAGLPGFEVDLHWSFAGIGVSADAFWQRLESAKTDLFVAGRVVAVPAVPHRLLLLVLHGAADRRHLMRARSDVRIAVQRVPLDLWRAAADEARVLMAEDALRVGLVRCAGGPELVAQLKLPPLRSPYWRSMSDGADGPALTILQLLGAPSFRSIGTVIWPSRAYMLRWGRANSVSAAGWRVRLIRWRRFAARLPSHLRQARASSARRP